MAYETILVKNLSELKTRRGNTNPLQCRVLGLNAPTSYMEVLYEWDNASVATGDDILVVHPVVGSALPGRWIKRRNDGAIVHTENIDFPEPGAHTTAFAVPFTVTGAAVGDAVEIIPPVSYISSGTYQSLRFEAYASDVDEVTAKVHNMNTSAIVSLPAADFKIIIRKTI
jgi:hypothetical protein